MNQVFVCSTYFHVYVSILKVIYSDRRNTKNLLIINDLTPGIAKILSRLSEDGFFDFSIQIPFKKIERKIKNEINILPRVFNRNKLIVEFVEANSEILMYNEFIENAEINIFPDLGHTAAYFLLKYKNNHIRMVEEGEGAYYLRVSRFKAFKREYLLNTFIGGGLDKEIKEIEVQFPEKLDKRVIQKGRKLALKEMVSKLTNQDRERILKIFMSGIEINIDEKKKLLLITQPLEESWMTEEKKIILYNQILSRYSNEYTVFIKPHPRENTDYNGKLDCPIIIIPGDFPLEMLDLLQGIYFDLGITICSTALYNMNNVDKKIILGRTYLTEPLPSNWYELYQ